MNAKRSSLDKLFRSFSEMMKEEMVEPKQKKSPQQKAHEDEIQNAILVLASEVIRCDRNYTGDTENFIRSFFVKQFGAARVQHKMKFIAGHLDMGTAHLLKIACKELKMLTTHDSRLMIVHFLFGVAAADDFVNAKEIRCIHRIAGYLGISDKDFKGIKQEFMCDNNPFSVLGIDEDASFDEVKTAYRKMILKSHPDKRNAETSEEEASLKFREIQRAFEIIRKQKG